MAEIFKNQGTSFSPNFLLDPDMLAKALRKKDGRVHSLGMPAAALVANPDVMEAILAYMQEWGHEILFTESCTATRDSTAAFFIFYE